MKEAMATDLKWPCMRALKSHLSRTRKFNSASGLACITQHRQEYYHALLHGWGSRRRAHIDQQICGRLKEIWQGGGKAGQIFQVSMQHSIRESEVKPSQPDTRQFYWAVHNGTIQLEGNLWICRSRRSTTTWLNNYRYLRYCTGWVVDARR